MENLKRTLNASQVYKDWFHDKRVKRNATFAMIFTEFNEHLINLTGNAAKFFMFVTLNMDYKEGKYIGSRNDILRLSGLSYPNVVQAIKELEGKELLICTEWRNTEGNPIFILNLIPYTL